MPDALTKVLHRLDYAPTHIETYPTSPGEPLQRTETPSSVKGYQITTLAKTLDKVEVVIRQRSGILYNTESVIKYNLHIPYTYFWWNMQGSYR